MSKDVKNSVSTINWVMVAGFVVLVWILIFGNLSGNLGFASGSQGYNDSEDIVNNLTEGAKNFSEFLPTILTIVGVVLLIVILLSLLIVVMKITKMGGGGGKSGYSETY